jgi:hypothetical protein
MFASVHTHPCLKTFSSIVATQRSALSFGMPPQSKCCAGSRKSLSLIAHQFCGTSS